VVGAGPCDHVGVDDERPLPDPDEGPDRPDEVEDPDELIVVEDADEPADVGTIDETDRPDEGEILYDCTTWAGESRAMLAALLDSRGVVHAWQGTTVSVREEDEEVVDELIDEVLASARPALDPDVDKVVYEVGSWPSALLTSLADALTVADLPYEWDEQGDLVIYAEHEEEVEVILDQLPDPDDEDAAPGDGLVLHEVLDRLFVGSDRLVRKPDDAGAVVAVDEAVTDLERMPRPFGFESPQWKVLVGRAGSLRDALEAEPGTEDALDDRGLSELAAEIRELVRRYV
jgi:hypothetical protein